MAINSETSPKTQVNSEVPQGTVLNPLLFLLFKNDQLDQVSPGTTTHLCVDDCLAYKNIEKAEDRQIFQIDLAALNNFNPAKCNIMCIHQGRTPL